MFVFLSKLLPLLVYPLGLACILLACALALSKHQRFQKAAILLALALLWLGSNRWVAYSLARSLEWRYLPLANVPTEEVIVVLGGATEASQFPRPSVEINSAGDRVLYAARLYHQQKAAHILLSGGYITWLDSRPSTPADEMAEILKLAGVPNEAIWLQKESRNTHEDAAFTCAILKEKGIHRVLLVTSAMHMPRAVALFSHQGIEVIPAPTDFTVTQSGWDSLTHPDLQAALIYLLPNTSSLMLTTNCLKEYLGLMVYTLQGWA